MKTDIDIWALERSVAAENALRPICDACAERMCARCPVARARSYLVFDYQCTIDPLGILTGPIEERRLVSLRGGKRRVLRGGPSPDHPRGA